MKALVGAACVAIIAFVVYFFWGEYQRREEQKLTNTHAEKRVCDLVISELKSKNFTQDWRVIHAVRCLENKHLTDNDFKNNGLGNLLDEAKPLVGKI